jgi:CheY-like chemotaxis protein
MAFSILCVDDEEAVLALFQRAFEKTDYTIYTARDGLEALEQVRQHRPDVVLLDVAMPTMRGDEALPLIHEIDPTTAVVIVSGQVLEYEARDLLAKGAFDFLEKPIDLKHLFDVVEHGRLAKELW